MESIEIDSKFSLKNKIKVLILLSVGLGILLYVIRIADVDLSIIYSIKDPFYIILALLFVIITRLVIALRLKRLLNSIETPANRPYQEVMIIDFISKFFYYISPFKLNVPAKAILLNKKSNISMRDSASVVSFEYALDTGITIVLGISGVTFLFQNTSLTAMTYILFLAGLFGVFFIGMPLRFFEIFDMKINQIRQEKVKKILSRISGLVLAIRGVWLKMLFNRQMYPILIITVISYIFAGYASKFIFLSTGMDIPFFWIILVEAAAMVAGGVSNIPGGLGVMEATMVLLYTNLGVPGDISITYVLVYRLFTLVPILIGYFFFVHLGTKYIKIK